MHLWLFCIVLYGSYFSFINLLPLHQSANTNINQIFFFFKEQLQALSRLKTWHQLNVVPLKKKSLTVLSITLTTRYKDSFLAITQKRSIKVDKSVVWGLMCDSFISWEFLKADLSCVLLPTVHSAVVLQ